MKILQQVSVKQILTEKSKQSLLESFTAKMEQAQRECDQLTFQLKKLEKTIISNEMRQQYKKEIEKRKDKLKILSFQIEQVHTLPLGSELKEREVQALVEVKVGDNWEEFLEDRTILITDGIVTEIR
ncbi:YlqD family protein [Metabacillus sp. GX 13764]|uniref:YlqD family protein n=1 Tax=Metabacillus kandeliae TaxID=2900151 RepID=UPI001E5C9ABE|nr:YlqD family protein [Metabacillus kandeliae]MCD7033804.1 YlqD family protein [Metabacillus kandeliae]